MNENKLGNLVNSICDILDKMKGMLTAREYTKTTQGKFLLEHDGTVYTVLIEPYGENMSREDKMRALKYM